MKLLLLPLLALAGAPALADFVTNGAALFSESPDSIRNYPIALPGGNVYRNLSPDGRFMAEIWGAGGESLVRWAVLRYPDGNRLVLGHPLVRGTRHRGASGSHVAPFPMSRPSGRVVSTPYISIDLIRHIQ